MERTKFTDEQMVFVLQQAETDTRVSDVCRKMGGSEVKWSTAASHGERSEGW